MGGRVARVLAVLLVMLGLGVGAGFAIGAATERQPTAMGAEPVPAVSPSVPVQTVAPYTDDIDYPTLGTDLRYAAQVVGTAPFAWGYAAPRGWSPQIIGAGEVVWTPEPGGTDGGYGMRVKIVSERKTPETMVTDKIVDLDKAVDDVDVQGRTSDSLAITYRSSGDRLRYNTFRWFTRGGQSAAEFEVSVFGRRQDLEGLGDLLDQISASVRFDPPEPSESASP